MQACDGRVDWSSLFADRATAVDFAAAPPLQYTHAKAESTKTRAKARLAHTQSALFCSYLFLKARLRIRCRYLEGPNVTNLLVA
jgi:hypothetical protein